MSTSYSDPVLDFDLSFLRPTPSSTVATALPDKQRKAILIVKKKIIATDALIKKYFAKKETLDETEKNLLTAKDECKQICIDYRKSVDTCSELEKDLQQLKDTKKELESKCSHLESQLQAANSHANQLQTLVKEHETLIEALKIENKLGKPSNKDYNKMLYPLQKENNLLIRHICLARDIIFGKRKYTVRHKMILKKYDNYKGPVTVPLFEEDESNDDYASDEIPLSPFSEDYMDDAEPSKGTKSETVNVNIKHSNNADLSRLTNNSIVESNDVASIDTGRGSSLAFSVSDKSFQSPDYFTNDSPLSDDHEINKDKTKLVDSSTSPVPFCIPVNVSTSPIVFEHNLLKNNNVMVDQALSPIVLTASKNDSISDNNDDYYLSDGHEINMDKTKSVDSSTSPVLFYVPVNVSTSPIIYEHNFQNHYPMMDRALSPIVLTAGIYDAICDNNDVSIIREKTDCQESCLHEKKIAEGKNKQNERECLELNNSENMSHENNNDGEIEMILSNMKLHNELITPIPMTPAKSYLTNKQNILCTPNKHNHSTGDACSETLTVRGDNSKIEALLSQLVNDVSYIKNIAINRAFVMQNNEESALYNDLCAGSDSNKNQLLNVTPTPPKQVSSNEKDTDLCVTEETSTTSRRKSLDTNMLDIGNSKNLHVFPGSKQNFHNIPTLQCEDLSENTNELDEDVTNVTEINVNNSEKSASNISKDSPSLTTNGEDKHKSIRSKKISKLAKLKQKFLPKYKIRREHIPFKKRNVKLKQITIPIKKKIVTGTDSSVTLNNKNVYENAVKIMTELKRKKSICIENEIRSIEQNVSEISSHNGSDTKGSEDQKLDESSHCNKSSSVMKCPSPNPIQIHLTSLKSRSKVTAQKVSNRNLSQDTAESIETVDLNKKHEKVNRQLSESHKSNKCLKRGSENISPEIPSKRVLRTSTLDIIKEKELKIILNRCDIPMIFDSICKSSPENIKNTSNYISVTPNSKKLPANNSAVGIVSPKVTHRTPDRLESTDTEHISSSRKESVKDTSCQQDSLNAYESQKNDRHTFTSTRRKSVRVLSFSDVTLKVPESQERYGKHDFISTQGKSFHSGDNLEQQENNVYEKLVTDGRTSVKGMSSPETDLKTIEIPNSNDNQGVEEHSWNQRKSVSNMSSPELSPKPTENQKRNDNHGLGSNRRKNIKDIMSSPEIGFKALEYQKRNDIQDIRDVIFNGRNSIQNNSPDFRTKTSENQETYDNQSIQNVTNSGRKSAKEVLFPETVPKTSQNHERLDSRNYFRTRNKDEDAVTHEISPKPLYLGLQPNKRRKIDTCGLEDNIMGPECLDSNGYRNDIKNLRESVLCRMIELYGVKSVKLGVKKVSDAITNITAKKIEDGIAGIIELPDNEAKDAMNKFVMDIQNWEIKHFILGLVKYLNNPARKIELFNKVFVISAPALTKSEQILIYVISELKKCWCSVDIVDKILSYIGYTLFSLNRTPQFEVIESMSHFYAVVCRYFKMKTRLRLFILDAMYCIQFKAIPLIRQCIEVWMHILPLAHMPSAQSPLVTCLVYLLHFYKCEDKLNRVQDMRNILSRKYFYKITEWNETKILELFANSIKALKGIPAETKMLRLALIILAKRQGPRWCHNNIIKNLLQPIIEKENNPEHIKAFCVSMLGPLLKPFPADMKVHCEIVMNQLITMLQDNQSPKIAEAIATSLLCMSKHNQFRVIQALVAWRQHKVSPELELMLKDFVKSKPLKIWKSTLSKVVQ